MNPYLKRRILNYLPENRWRWFQEISPAWRELIDSVIDSRVNQKAQGEIISMADLIYEAIKYDGYVCHNRVFMKFYNHRWRDEGLCSISLFLDTLEKYSEIKEHYVESLDSQEIHRDLPKYFVYPHIEFDRNPWLICFENGVYDLKLGVFRPGRPDDYCRMSTGYSFVNRGKLDPEQLEEVWTFLRQLFPSKKILNYALQVMASWLVGGNCHHKLDIWIGPGANGKSSLFNLVKASLGKYCEYCSSVRVYTIGGAANPEAFKLKDARIASITGDHHNLGQLKSILHGEEIIARHLYKEPEGFKPFANLMMMCNDIPENLMKDPGMRRRLRVLRFESTFVEKPGEKHQYLRDPKIEDKFVSWRSAFMWILLEEFNKLMSTEMEIREPASVAQRNGSSISTNV